MATTVFPAPGTVGSIQWNIYTSTATASSSGTTVTLSGKTIDLGLIGSTPAVVSGTGQFANNTVISSAAYINTYTVSFNGTNQYLLAPSTGTNAAFTFAGNFTVEGWFYPTTITGSDHAIFCLGTETTNRYVWYISNGGGITSNLYGFGSRTYAVSTPVNTWTHIAIVRSGSTVSVYVNGVVSSTTDTQAGTIGNGSIKIGSDSSGVANFAGYISNFRIVSGVAVYSNTFTLPTTALAATQSANANGNPSSAITGTQTSILTCQSSTIIDNGTANAGVGFTISNPNTSTTIVGTVPGNTFTVNIAPTVALSSASITISESAINGMTDSRAAGKASWINTVRLVPFTSRAYVGVNFGTITPMQKQIEVIRAGASPNNILVGKASRINTVRLVPFTSRAYVGVNFGNVTPLQKQIEIIRADKNILVAGKASSTITVRSAVPRVSADIVTKLNVPKIATEVFYTPAAGNTKVITSVRLIPLTSRAYVGVNFGNVTTLQKQIEVIRADRTIIATGKASSITLVRSTTPKISADVITKLRLPNSNSSVFYAPITGKASSAVSLRSNGSSIISNTLENFNNAGLVTAPYLTGSVTNISNIIPVTGASSYYTTDIINWIIFDNTFIKSTPANINIATYYFNNTVATTLFPAGSTIYVYNYNSNYLRAFTVLSISSNSITFTDPGDLPPTSGTYIVGSSYKATIAFSSAQTNTPYSSGSYVSVTDTLNVTSVISVSSSGISSMTFNTTNLSYIGYLANSTVLSLASASVPVYPTLKVSVSGPPTTPRERLFYSLMSPGKLAPLSAVFGTGISSSYNTISSGQLQKKIEIIKNPSPTDVLIFDVFNLQKQIEVIRADKNILVAGKASSITLVRSTTPKISADVITKLNVPKVATEVFYTPAAGNTKVITSVRLIPLTGSAYVGVNFGNVTTLQKQIEVIRSTTPKISADIVTKLNVPKVATEVFYTPAAGKTSTVATRLVSDKNTLATGKASSINLVREIPGSDYVFDANSLQKQIEIIKSVTSVISSNSLTRLKFPAIFSKVFYTPTGGNTRSVTTVQLVPLTSRAYVGVNFGTVTPLQKQIAVIKNPTPKDSIVFNMNNIQKQLPSLGTVYTSALGNLLKLKFSAISSEVFYAPDLGKSSVINRLKADRSVIAAGKMLSIQNLRSVVPKVSADVITKLSVPKIDTQVFYTPFMSSMQKKIESMRADRTILATGKASTVNKLRDFVNITLTGKLSTVTSLKSDKTTLPTYRMETYDNIGLTTDPFLSGIVSIPDFISVVGRSVEYTSDVILYYLYDQNTITSIPINTPLVTLYIDSGAIASSVFPAGSVIRVVDTQVSYDTSFTVISSDANSVTFADPGTLPSISTMYVSANGFNAIISFTSPQTRPPYGTGSYVLVKIDGQSASLRVLSGTSSSITVNVSGNSFIGNGSIVDLANDSLTVWPQTFVNPSPNYPSPRQRLIYQLMVSGSRLNQFFADNTPKGLIKPQPAIEKRFFKIAGVDKKSNMTAVQGLINKFTIGAPPRRLGEVFDVAYVPKVPIQFWN